MKQRPSVVKGGTDGSNNKDIDEMKKKLDELFE